MIPKIQTRGSSFKGLASYLTHDPKAETKDRVDWTHTLNLAHDHVPSAVDEMLWTARNAELLKQEAGIRAGGRETENTVKHFSLNWSPEDNPTREHMIAATEDFLGHMGWREHQALLVAHNDKSYAHVHGMLNAVHPETGLKLDESFDQRRAQAWALGYEQEQGRIYCEQRLLDAAEREDAPTRPGWLAFQEKQREFERDEKNRRDQEPILIRDPEMPENTDASEWKILKDMQRQERQDFFAAGKTAFSELRSSIYHEVREEFREQWADFYAAQKEGAVDAEALAKTKAALVAEQKDVLETRRDEACSELRATRNDKYRELLDEQRDLRHGLQWRQDAGFENGLFLQIAADRHAPQDVTQAFREAAEAATDRQEMAKWQADDTTFTGGHSRDPSGLKSGGDVGANVGIGVGIGLIDILGGIADGLVGSKPAPKPPRQPASDLKKPDLFEVAIDQARQRQRAEQDEADRELRLKQRGADGI